MHIIECTRTLGRPWPSEGCACATSTAASPSSTRRADRDTSRLYKNRKILRLPHLLRHLRCLLHIQYLRHMRSHIHGRHSAVGCQWLKLSFSLFSLVCCTSNTELDNQLQPCFGTIPAFTLSCHMTMKEPNNDY